MLAITTATSGSQDRPAEQRQPGNHVPEQHHEDAHQQRHRHGRDQQHRQQRGGDDRLRRPAHRPHRPGRVPNSHLAHSSSSPTTQDMSRRRRAQTRPILAMRRPGADRLYLVIFLIRPESASGSRASGAAGPRSASPRSLSPISSNSPSSGSSGPTPSSPAARPTGWRGRGLASGRRRSGGSPWRVGHACRSSSDRPCWSGLAVCWLMTSSAAGCLQGRTCRRADSDTCPVRPVLTALARNRRSSRLVAPRRSSDRFAARARHRRPSSYRF